MNPYTDYWLTLVVIIAGSLFIGGMCGWLHGYRTAVTDLFGDDDDDDAEADDSILDDCLIVPNSALEKEAA